MNINTSSRTYFGSRVLTISSPLIRISRWGESEEIYLIETVEKGSKFFSSNACSLPSLSVALRLPELCCIRGWKTIEFHDLIGSCFGLSLPKFIGSLWSNMDPDMNAPLKRRFFKWVAPLIILLQAYGVDLHQLNRTRRTCRYSIRLWGWLLLLIQSLGFIGQYADRLLTFKLTVSQICNLTTRSNMLVTCSMITSFVIFMAGPRLASLINFLEKIDRSLNRPDLSFLYRRSLIGVFWILITVFWKFRNWPFLCISIFETRNDPRSHLQIQLILIMLAIG